MNPVSKAQSKTLYDSHSLQGYADNAHRYLDFMKTKQIGAAGTTEDKTKQLKLGQSAANAQPWFIKQVKALAEKIGGKRLKERIPLKKVNRIYEKGVAYAVENNYVQIPIERVRDVLRDTIVLEVGDLENLSGGQNNIIDQVNKIFHGNVLQVKNRFIETHFPCLPPNTANYTENEIEQVVLKGLRGRDTFYRDLQFLILIDKKHGANPAPFKYHIAELQIAIRPIAEGKHDGGHDIYKSIRRVMEYFEYKYFKNKYAKKQEDFKYKEAESFYKKILKQNDLKDFPKNINSMVDTYRKGINLHIPKTLCFIINNSKWFKDSGRKA